MAKRRKHLSAEDYVQGILNRHIPTLARAITLVESTAPRHAPLAEDVLTRIMPHTGNAIRVGITGVPGVGKSTFIDALGTHLTQNLSLRVAVLAIDPSSTRSGGSILGDKTRMQRLSADPNAFIRPSPTSGTLGGIAARTREALLLCEAAGFDVILVETVGVGQSELLVSHMTDFFLALMLAGAGDELQGIKRGLMEVADALAVNKADGDNLPKARRAARTYRSALRTLRPPSHDDPWSPTVLTCSALHDTNIDTVWDTIQEHKLLTTQHGSFHTKRQHQRVTWLWQILDHSLQHYARNHPNVTPHLPSIEHDVRTGVIPASRAAHRILQLTFTPS